MFEDIEFGAEKSELEQLADRIEARIDALIEQRHKQGTERDYELDRLSRKIEQTINAVTGAGVIGQAAAWFEVTGGPSAFSPEFGLERNATRYVYEAFASSESGPLIEGKKTALGVEPAHTAALDLVSVILCHLNGARGTVHWRKYPEWREHEGNGHWFCRLVVVPA